MRTRLLPLLAATAAAAVVVAAGSAAAAPAKVSPIETAANATVTSSYSYRMSLRLTTPSAPTPLTIRVSGVSQHDPQVIEMKMDMTDLMKASGAPAANGVYTMILAGSPKAPVFYLSGGVFKQLLPAGRTWARVDGAQYTKISGADLSKQLSNGADISSFLSVLKAAGATVVKTGSEPVGKTPATRYRVTVAVDRMLESQGFSAAEVAKQKASYRTKSVAYDVWLDGHERPLRLLLNLPVQSQGQKIDELIDMTLSDFGSAAKVSVPDASLVKDITSVLAAQVKKSAG
jgi:hypothetical protein